MSIEMRADLRLLGVEAGESQADHPKPEKKGGLQGSPVEFREPELWSEPVDGGSVLIDIAEFIQTHMAIRDEDAYAVALWCAHTHVFKIFSHTPRLAITAPAPECGKTVLLTGIIKHLVRKPMGTDNISPAAFFRLAASDQPTFLIDEVDAWLKADSDLPGALNGGWEAGGRVIRCVGDHHSVHAFPTHTPVAMAGIRLASKLPDATLSRSIVIELERALPGEINDPYERRKHQQSLIKFNRKLARWCKDNETSFSAIHPQMPPDVFNRRRDKWEPLFIIAEMAGAPWQDWATRALLSESKGESQERGIQLLTDVRDIIRRGSYDPGIFTDELIIKLSADPERRWADYNFGGRDLNERKIKPRQLANLLKAFNCQPETFRRENHRLKGYKTDKLEMAIKRYLPPELSVTA